MSVLVTGGAGYIGSHTVLALIDAGFKVIVLDDLSTGLDWLVNPHAKLYVGDCGDRQLVASLISRHDIHTIIHFAGSIVVPDSVVDPLGYYLNNTIKSHALVSCAVEHNVANFIFSSTAAVYGDANVSPIPENTPLAPASPYSSLKMMAEVMLHDASRAHGLKYAVQCFILPFQSHQHQSERVMKAGIVWSQSEGGSQHALAFAFLTEVAVQIGEVDRRRRILGTQSQSGPVLGLGIRRKTASSVHRLKQHSTALRPLRASGGAPTWAEGIALNCKNRAAANQVLSVMIVSLAP